MKGPPLFLAALLILPAEDVQQSQWSRFAQMSTASQLEEMAATQLLRDQAVARRLAVREFRTPTAPPTAALKVEWYLRLGPETVPLVFGDLIQLQDTVLLDAALWALLREEMPVTVFSEGVDWNLLRRRFGAFLRTHSPDSLFAEEHGSWWRWMRDGGVPSHADPLLKSLHRWFKGASVTGEARWPFFLDAYGLLGGEAVADDREALLGRIFELMGANNERSTRTAAQVVAAANTQSRQAAAHGLLRDFAARWKESGQSRIAADALARAFMMALRSGQELDADEVLFLADEEFEAGEYDLAHEFYLYGRDQIVDVNEAQAMEFASGVARARWKSVSAKKQVVLSAAQADELIGLFERALDRAFRSDRRDLLLLDLIEVLERAARHQARQEAALLLFKHGLDAQARRLGLEAAVSSAAKLFEDSGAVSLLKEYLDYLATAQKVGSAAGFLKQHSTRARVGLEKLQVLSTDPLWATLHEIEAGAR